MGLTIMRYSALIVVAILAGCARQEIAAPENRNALGENGLWSGDLETGKHRGL